MSHLNKLRRPPRRRRKPSHRPDALLRSQGLLPRSRAFARSASRSLLERRLLFTALLLAGMTVICGTAWPFVRAHLQAVAILDQISGKPTPAILGEIVAVPITVEDRDLQVESGKVRARFYLPENRPNAPALIVLHGVHHLGIDEPRLEAFAAAMASTGLRVLTPELPDIKDYHVDSTSIRMIGESAQWFAKQTGGPVGVMGLSFSGGLALLAAADPLYKPDFKFVFAVGSQDSMSRVAQYYRTGEDERPNGTTQLLAAHEYGPLVLEYEYVEDFVPKRDVAAVRAVLRAHLYEDKVAEAEADTKLDESQRIAMVTLLDSTSPKTRALIAKAMARHVDELNGLSPRGHLRTMTTPVYLLHGQGDNIIPSAETLWMASELPNETLQAMLVSPVISHIDFEGVKPGVRDEWQLVHFFALVMHAAQTKSGRAP